MEEVNMEQYISELQDRKRRSLEFSEKKKKLDNQLAARERIEKLVDLNSFLELGMLAHSDVPGYEEKTPADGIVCGLAKIDGRPVVVEAIDKTVMAGTEGAVHLRKSHMIHDYAIKRGLPIFNLAEGGGLRMPDGMGSDGISDKLFPESLLTVSRQVPMVTGIFGDSFGGPTWMAVSSDFVSQVKGSCMAVAGPRMLEIATGEQVELEELGGWKIHSALTGQVDHTGDNEQETIAAMKEFFSFLPSHQNDLPPVNRSSDDPNRQIEELLDLVPTRRTRAYDMKKVIKAIVDDGYFFELKPMFGKSLITGLARLNGRAVGIIANQPIQFAGSSGSDECDKATDFICLCDSFHLPIIFLHDIPGFRVSSGAEKKRIPTKIMVWNQALARSTVPKISIILRKSIGAAYGNMCGPTMGGDFVFAWPTAEINFTGPEVGINVVYGRKLMQSENPKEARQELLAKWEFDSSPYKAAGKYYIDDIIDPRDTRKILCQTIEYACHRDGGKSKRLLAGWPTGF
ncbi:acyl-CoA carboxylase subunit beta [Alkalihalobacillus sp. BA299]|uniref:acyl-CoA carboxylase subunit beta n=1 Tax=Alkalihalobacillus sp. BA299 TaxID=2815938 RepID=UPI001ADD4C08|nr:carboxyl transferase domain-containing protein [Alkalihalobacillus sp. BA299]